MATTLARRISLGISDNPDWLSIFVSHTRQRVAVHRKQDGSIRSNMRPTLCSERETSMHLTTSISSQKFLSRRYSSCISRTKSQISLLTNCHPSFNISSFIKGASYTMNANKTLCSAKVNQRAHREKCRKHGVQQYASNSRKPLNGNDKLLSALTQIRQPFLPSSFFFF